MKAYLVMFNNQYDTIYCSRIHRSSWHGRTASNPMWKPLENKPEEKLKRQHLFKRN